MRTKPTAPINLSAVMRDAWTQCRGFYAARGRAFRFDPTEFAFALRCSWHDARMAQLVPVTTRNHPRR
ncbi:MAG TPA: hypothetical protein VGN97_13420 [Mesorhizobium sp.]|jgi:hypothetical protein|nr:hypothetical protein [Mesorhizobium sp.]